MPSLLNFFQRVRRRLFRRAWHRAEKRRMRDEARASSANGHPFDLEARLLMSIGVDSPMLDVGANDGVYSTLLEEIVTPERLILVEPLPHLARVLRARFPQSRVVEAAASNRPGSAVIKIPYIRGRRFDTRATLNSHGEVDQTGFEQISVTLRTLDEIVDSLKLDSVGFVKIDVEGHENEVIEGATRTFRRFAPLILIEIEQRHHDTPIRSVFDRLEALGYRGYFLDPESHAIVDLSNFVAERHQRIQDLNECRPKYVNNFFFISLPRLGDFLTRGAKFLEAERPSAGQSPAWAESETS